MHLKKDGWKSKALHLVEFYSIAGQQSLIEYLECCILNTTLIPSNIN